MATETRRIFFGFQRRFQFWKFSSRWLPLTGLGQIQRKTKNPVFITFFGLKDCGGFKGRREMSRYQVVPFAISANFGCNLSAKVYASENPFKNGDFLVGFSAKNPVKSDKLALIEGKILNLMFFILIFRWYPLRFGYE